MRPGSFKVATETRAGSRCGRPGAGAAPAGCARHGAGLGGCRGQVLTLPQPFLSWGHPKSVGKGMAVVQGQHRAGNCGAGSAALGRWECPGHHSQPLHQEGEFPPHCCCSFRNIELFGLEKPSKTIKSNPSTAQATHMSPSSTLTHLLNPFRDGTLPSPGQSGPV